MRIDIDAGVDRYDALERTRGAKQPGRKHNHQPRGRAHQKMLQRPANRQRLLSQQRRKRATLVAAYWRGEIEQYPSEF